MTKQTIRKLDKLIESYEMCMNFGGGYYRHEEINASMIEIRTQAEKLQQNIADEETKKRVAGLIQRCNKTMYSHKTYVEHEQFVVLETYDAKKKFVVIDAAFGAKDNRIVACEYDDAMQNGKAVLNYDYLISIEASPPTSYEAHQLIDQVRKNSGESTLLYGHKEVHTLLYLGELLNSIHMLFRNGPQKC